MSGAVVLASRLAGSLTPPGHASPFCLQTTPTVLSTVLISVLPYFEDADALG